MRNIFPFATLVVILGTSEGKSHHRLPQIITNPIEDSAGQKVLQFAVSAHDASHGNPQPTQVIELLEVENKF